MISNIEIENFKCFEQLKVNDLKRVNLIGGKNNIGKTAFMEAVELFVESQNIDQVIKVLLKMIQRRDTEKDLNSFISHQKNKFIIGCTLNNCLSLEVNKESKSFHIKVNNQEQDIPMSKIIESILPEFIEKPILQLLERSLKDITVENVNFISASKSDENIIAKYYGALVDLNQEEFLDRNLTLFDSIIKSLKVKPNSNSVTLKLQVSNSEYPVPLSYFGDGINRYIAILTAIWASKDGYLFIDEIENGIHYANYEKLWRIIFEASKEANCQVFATTHSKECIESFNKISNDEDGTYLEFYRNEKTNQIGVLNTAKEKLTLKLERDKGIRGE